MTALTHKENDLHNRLIVAEFNLGQAEKELRRLHEENEALRARLAQPEPEPVACPYCHYSHTLGAVYFDQNCAGCVKRMTAPPQREWQGAQPEPKPLAWLEPEWGEQICLEVGFEHTITIDHPKDLCWIPLYTAPPQREWQGLTDEEIKSAWSQLWYDLGNGKFAASDDSARHTTIMFAKEIEAKLKEKNT